MSKEDQKKINFCETLELLEELVDSYQGTVLLVSHDREFVDNSVTECWIFEGNGVINRYAGGYFDAQQQKAQTVSLKNLQPSKIADEEKLPKGKEPSKRNNKISYHLLRELEQLPSKLEQLEGEIEALQNLVGDADFFNQPHDVTEKTLSALAQKEQELEQAFDRWQELELLKNG